MAMKVFTQPSVLGAADINEYLVNTLYAVKGSGTTRTGSTLSDDPDLSVNIGTNRTFLVEVIVPMQGGNGGLKFNFGAPAGALLYGYWQLQFGTTGSGNTQGSGYDGGTITANFNTTQSFGALTVLGTDVVIVRGWLQTSGTAGNFTFRWCQNSNVNSLTAIAGAAMFLRRVS